MPAIIQPKPIIAALLLIGAALIFGYHLGTQKTTNNQPATTTATLTPPASKPTWQTPALQTINDTATPRNTRLQAARDLPADLDATTMQEIAAYLSTPPASDRETWYLLVNELMETLRKRETPPPAFADTLITLSRSATTDPVIADYAIQHLVLLADGQWQERPENQSPADPALYLAVIEAAKASHWAGETLPGTAIQALTASADLDLLPPEARAALETLVTETADGTRPAATINRAAALQAGARLKLPVQPLCRQILADTAAPPDLRLAAIATLGLSGTPDDQPLLQTLSQQPALHHAAREALKKLTPAPQ